MELVVRPEDLHAAAAAISACAHRLDEAGQTFARAAARDVPDLGREVADTAGRSAACAQRAAATIAGDVAELARALQLLAAVYAEIDRRAVRG